MAFLDETSEARTERPTERRRRQARERGMVAHGVEILTAARLLAIWIVLAWWFANFATSASSTLRAGLEQAGNTTHHSSTALIQLRDLTWQLLGTVSWPLGTVTAALVLAHFAQVGWLWRWESAAPQPARLSPIAGLHRLASLATIGQALKLILKLIIAITASSFVLSPFLSTSTTRTSTDLADQLTAFGSTAMQLVASIAMALLTYSALDYAWQYWCFERSLQMTRDEVREELKEIERASHLTSHRHAHLSQHRDAPTPTETVSNSPAST